MLFRRCIFIFLLILVFLPQFTKAESLVGSLMLQIESLKQQVLQLQAQLVELQKKEQEIGKLKLEMSDFYEQVDDFRLSVSTYSNKTLLYPVLMELESRARELSVRAFEYGKYDSSWMMDRIAYSFSGCQMAMDASPNFFNEWKSDAFWFDSILWEINFSISWLNRDRQVVLPNREFALQSITSLKADSP